MPCPIFYCTIYEHLGFKRPISNKYILKKCSPYIFLVFFSVAPFNKRFSGPKDLNKKWTQLIQSPTNSTINFGDIVCSHTHLFSKDSGCICLLIRLLTQDELKNPPLWSYLGHSTDRSTQYRRCQQHTEVKTCTEVKGLWVMKSKITADSKKQKEKVTGKDWKSKCKGRRHM